MADPTLEDVELSELGRELIAAELKDYQLELQRITAQSNALKKAREALLAKAVPLQRKLGSTVIEGIDGKPYVASVIQSETLQCDPGRLLEALIEQEGGNESVALTIWLDVLKPREVDTKDGGLLEVACTPVGDAPARILPETLVAAGAHYKKNAAYIGFSKPGG